MPLSGSAFWACLLPVEKTNLYDNPSAERGTRGWSDVSIESIGTDAAHQTFGAWSLDIVCDNAANESVASGGSWTSGNGTAYTASAYVWGAVGSTVKMAVGTANNSISGASIAGSVTIAGGGTWHRYNIPYTETANQNRRLLVWGSAYGQEHIYVDGIQVEVGSLTTFIDGDQEGCYWLGQPHQSQSLRSGTSRAGGSIVALADLGLKPDDTPGAGMPPLETLSQSFALDPGSEFLNQRAGERTFVLTCKPIAGTTQADYHRVRRGLIMALKSDAVEPQSPVRLWYTGGQGTIQIDAVLAGGFDAGDRSSPMTEEIAVRFIAHDPYWYSTTQQGTALLGRTALGSTNFIAKRDPFGRWGTLGNAGTTVNSFVDALAYANGTLYVGGRFGSAGGTLTGGLVFYRTDADRFGTFGGTVNSSGGVQTVTVDADGTVIFGGAFTGISGLSNTRFIARWSGGFATITGGTTSAKVNDMAWTGGTLALGGAFTGVSGTTTGQLALWTRAGYGSTSNGTIATEVFGVAVGLDRRIFVGLQAAGANAAGTTANHVAQWFGSWGTLSTGMETSGAGVQGVAVGPNGIFYAGGEFQNAGGGSAFNVAQWNGVQWMPMGSGVGQDTAGVIEITKMFADQQTGDIYELGGAIREPASPDNIAKWNGYTWLPLDIDLPSGNINTMTQAPERTLYFGGAFSGTAQAASVAQIVNGGMADAYPTFRARNNSGGTIRLYQLINTLTGAALYFNLRLEIGEEVVYVSEPGNRSFTSSFRGNVFSSILPGSNQADFSLKPGTNYLSFFADSGSVNASVFWTPRSDSFDAGTNF